jgi:hypothetical protein
MHFSSCCCRSFRTSRSVLEDVASVRHPIAGGLGRHWSIPEAVARSSGRDGTRRQAMREILVEVGPCWARSGTVVV